MISKNIIQSDCMTIWFRDYNEKKFELPHLIGADRIEFIENHLMFYFGRKLIFKIWLKEGKWRRYKDINHALKNVGIKVLNIR